MSILCILSKVFEQVIFDELCHFLEVKVHYNQTQWGFQKEPSTTTFLLKLRDDIKRARNTSIIGEAPQIIFFYTSFKTKP